MKSEMNCKQFEKSIPLFLNDELDTDETEVFLQHVSSCSECREELSIQYLVHAGLAKLEAGETFNLGLELAENLTSMHRKVIRRKRLYFSAIAAEVLSVLSVAGGIYVMYRIAPMLFKFF